MMKPLLMELLEEQYALTENFANAQTRLFNSTRAQQGSTTQWDAKEVAKAVSGLHKAKTQVRSNFECILNDRAVAERYPEHIALSRRVLQTISRNPMWTSIGTSSGSGNLDSFQANTVALATLNASIARLRIEEAETDAPRP